jgi:hypothetical protein
VEVNETSVGVRVSSPSTRQSSLARSLAPTSGYSSCDHWPRARPPSTTMRRPTTSRRPPKRGDLSCAQCPRACPCGQPVPRRGTRRPSPGDIRVPLHREGSSPASQLLSDEPRCNRVDRDAERHQLATVVATVAASFDSPRLLTKRDRRSRCPVLPNTVTSRPDAGHDLDRRRASGAVAATPNTYIGNETRH